MATQNPSNKPGLGAMPVVLLLLVQLLAFWRAWQWYVNRIWESPEEALALVVVLTVLCVCAIQRLRAQPGVRPPWGLLSIGFGLYTLLTLISAPMLLRTAAAVLTVGATMYAVGFGGRKQVPRPRAALWGLLLLCMPLVPTLQFYLGYPARLISAAITVVLLNANGYAVIQEGVFLRWNGELIQFDAPCSGITMLWAAWLICCVFALLQGFNVLRTGLMLAGATLITLLGNSFRAASLFYLELDVAFAAQAWMHEAVGLIVFAGIITSLYSASIWLAQAFVSPAR
tara:strand:- start:3278 stop:4132 length:855 start_codon:yes stop_codon:yes gene_type:complete